MVRCYEALADVLEYPGSDWNARLDRLAETLGRSRPDCLGPFLAFRRHVEELSETALQELYVGTFDMNPASALEVGCHVFGEDYRRGLLLARLRETESPYDLGQKGQLPDYLPVLLRLLGKLGDLDLREALIGDIAAPAVCKIADALSEKESPYAHLMRVVASLLERDAKRTGARVEGTAAGW